MRSAGPFFVVKFRRQVATGPGAGAIRSHAPDVNSPKQQAASFKQQAA
tara:strand:+ start:460 stop:603 length:144 start_codon:yes stop_codon:yes gene_type:complete